MPEVHISSPDHNIEKHLRDFKRRVDKAGIAADARKNMAHTPPTKERKHAKAAAKKRWEKKQKKERDAMSSMMRSRLSKRAKKQNDLVARIKAESASTED